MSIQSKEDWIAEARYVVPLLPEYMASVSGQADPDMVAAELNKHLDAQDWKTLHQRFSEIWSWLPDRPDIHRHPFGRFCDLCSEYWVFEEEEAA